MIWQGWLPSRLTLSEANSLAIMGAFVLVFVIRMAGATMRKKEEAEAQMSLSEDRFRSLIQNSSDITLVMDEFGICTFASPASSRCSGTEPVELVGQMATDLVHPDDRDRVEDRLGPQFQEAPGSAPAPVPDAPKGRNLVRRRGGRVEPARPPLGRRIRRQRP